MNNQRETMILDELPVGWVIKVGATNHPIGFKWCSNSESRFGGKYKHALLKEKHEDNGSTKESN